MSIPESHPCPFSLSSRLQMEEGGGHMYLLHTCILLHYLRVYNLISRNAGDFPETTSL